MYYKPTPQALSGCNIEIWHVQKVLDEFRTCVKFILRTTCVKYKRVFKLQACKTCVNYKYVNSNLCTFSVYDCTTCAQNTLHMCEKKGWLFLQYNRHTPAWSNTDARISCQCPPLRSNNNQRLWHGCWYLCRLFSTVSPTYNTFAPAWALKSAPALYPQPFSPRQGCHGALRSFAACAGAVIRRSPFATAPWTHEPTPRESHK